MDCPSCNYDNRPTAKFCIACGTSIQARCVQCGFQNPAAARFCEECGATFDGHGAVKAQPQPGSPAIPAQSVRWADAQRRQLTVMFCDLVGSTALSARLDPEDLREVMSQYHNCCARVVERFGGFAAAYMGDGVLAYFGYPQAYEDDAERAVRAGLELISAVNAIKPRPEITLRSRIGIATGLVVISNLGSGVVQEQSVVGETPNLAARLQAYAEPDTIIIAVSTYRLLGSLFEYRDMGPAMLKGFPGTTQVWQVLRPSATESRFDATRNESALTPLLGRDEELALLLRRWQDVCDGEGQVVLVGGEPGIGKSRLTRTLRERLLAKSYFPLRYQCSPYHIDSALYPVIEQLERAAGFTREDTSREKLDKLEVALTGSSTEVAQSAPLLAALLMLPGQRYAALELSPEKQKEKTLEALIGQIEALARRKPVLMIFEDAHWIDSTSQETLDLLVPWIRRLPVLLIVTYRPEYVPKWGDHSHVTILGLTRFGRRQAAEMATQVAGGKTLPKEVLDQIVAHTDGVPLFVEELTKSILESELVRDNGDHYVLDGPLPALAIPTTLRDSLIARLDRLAPVREVAQVGACIGREFSYNLLEAVSPMKGSQLDDALAQLTASGLLLKRGAGLDANYTFKHALVQDAAYDSLLKSKRLLLHARLAQVLKRDFSDQVANAPELLAYHYTQSGNLAEAIPWWGEAGKLAAQRVALREAASHFQKGLLLLQQLPPAPERDQLELSIREPLNAALTGLHGWADAEVSVNAIAIVEVAKRRGQPQTLATGLWAMWVNTTTQGRVEDSLEWAERLLAEGEQIGDIDLRMFGHGAAMISNFCHGRLADAQKHGGKILELYDPHHASRWMQVTANDFKTLVGIWSCQWTWMLGYPDQAVRMSDERNAHARQLGHAFNLGFALTLGAYVFDYRREPARLLEHVREADRLERERSVPFVNQVMVPQVEGLARLRNGQLPEAVFALRRGLENWNSRGGHTRVPYLKSALAEALALQGNLDAALLMINECLEQIERPGWREGSHLAEVLRLKAWILMRLGQDEEAETVLHASIDWARQQQARSWELRSSTTLAQLFIEHGRLDAARDLLAPIYNWFTEGFDTHDLRAARTLLQSLN